jgi:thymidine phosphorylase
LRGCGPADTTVLVESLGGAMLVLGGVAATLAEGEARIRSAIRSGAGLDRFRAMVSFQGGDPRVADDPSLLPSAASRRDVPAPSDGCVTSVDCERVGIAALVIGGGRRRKEDSIDPAVGLRIRARIGARVDAGQPLATIEFNDPAHVDHAAALVTAAYGIGPEPPATGPLVLETIGL